jgi:hypothetical protein
MSYVFGLGSAGMTLADHVKLKWTELANKGLIEDRPDQIAKIPSTTTEAAFRAMISKVAARPFSEKNQAALNALSSALEQAIIEHNAPADVPKPAPAPSSSSIPVVPVVVGFGALLLLSRLMKRPS